MLNRRTLRAEQSRAEQSRAEQDKSALFELHRMDSLTHGASG